MEVTREIVVPAPAEEVWAALTEADRLEEWFANDVELDPRPGGEGVFRWENGEELHATVEEIEEERRLALRWDDGGEVELDAGGGRRRHPVVVRESSPEFGPALELQRSPLRSPDVFAALADPSRRFVLETLAQRGSATATELAAELPVTRQAVAKHLAALTRGRARRADAGRP